MISILLCALQVAQAPGNAPAVPAALASRWEQLIAAEDARAATPEQLNTLLQLSHDRSAQMRRLAVRALGRLERAALSDTIARALHDESAAVRSQAAISIAQANMPNRTPSPMRDTILAALMQEKNPAVLAALGEALGRLRNPDVGAARIASARLAMMLDKDPVQRLGALRGLQFIMRQSLALRVGIDTARNALIAAATARTGNDTLATRARRLATQILALTKLADAAFADVVLRDPDPYVRREAMLIAASATDTALVRSVASRGLRDPFWLVRYVALQQYGRRLGAFGSCEDLMPYAHDANIHVRLLAIDQLSQSNCRVGAHTIAFLDSLARVSAPVAQWHSGAHALVSLAMREHDRMRPRLAGYVSHPNLFARTYAAAAAGFAADTATLRLLARDAHPNVRTAAIHQLSALMHHAADSIFVAQLDQDDGQLLMEASAALDSTTTPGVAVRLLDALDRVSRERTENSRDGREALLKVAGHLGTAALSDRVRPYLRDFDPAIANRAADVLKDWTGARPEAHPESLPLEPTPSYKEATRLARTRITLHMATGDSVRIRLLPFDAPTNAARFERLARSGYFNGLSLHRVEPTFVVQGGSPNANEYRGAPRFSRDEIAVPNWRGTIGLSTRGHDTGDAQIYINTIDNVLLDQLFTIFAEVTGGMDAVERMLEGAVIRRVSVTN